MHRKLICLHIFTPHEKTDATISYQYVVLESTTFLMPTTNALDSRTKLRRYCFTVFEKADEAPPEFTRGAPVRFIVMQKEKCPRTERIHWQGYIELTRACRYSDVKNVLKREAHLTRADGTSADNIRYCTKEDTRIADSAPIQWGTPADGLPGEAREDTRASGKKQMDLLIEDMKAGVSEEQLSNKYPKLWLLHRQKIMDFLTDLKARSLASERPVFVEVRWGSPGTGKTSSIFKPNPVSHLFNPPLACFRPRHVYFRRAGLGQWYDGYTGQEVLVLDDFYPRNSADCEYLLGILDKFTQRLQIKGGTVMSCWRHVIITCNIPVAEWFKDSLTDTYIVSAAKRDAVYDRIARVTEFTGPSHRQDPANMPSPWIPPLTPVASQDVVAEHDVDRSSTDEESADDSSASSGEAYPYPTPYESDHAEMDGGEQFSLEQILDSIHAIANDEAETE